MLLVQNLPSTLARTIYQGFGATTAGGSRGTVVHVTNLNDSGPGSLRQALSQGNRTVVFDIAGEIVVKKKYIHIRGAFITIDGFTAPPPGITLMNGGLAINGKRGAHDVIVRNIRVRSAAKSRSVDCISIMYGAFNVVVDHVSVSDCADGLIDITKKARDVTISWSILAKPRSTRSMLIRYEPSHVTLHHNLFVNSKNRNPDVSGKFGLGTGTTVDMRNNVVWNWGGGRGTIIKHGARVNVVNNYYSNFGFSTTDKKQAIIACRYDGTEIPEHRKTCRSDRPTTQAYIAGNISGDGVPGFDINAVSNMANALPAPFVDTQDACTAARAVLASAGVRPLDLVDQQYLSAISLPSCP